MPQNFYLDKKNWSRLSLLHIQEIWGDSMANVNVDLDGSNISIPRTEPLKKMITVTTLPDGRTLVEINSSSLDVIQSCLRKAKLSLLERWIPEDEAPSTIFGSAVHAFMEHFYLTRPEERKMPKLETLEAMAVRVIDGETEDPILRSFRAFVTAAKPLHLLPDLDKRSIMNGAWILFHYLRVFIDDPYTALMVDGKPFLERKFEHIIHEDEQLVIKLFGTVDFAWVHTRSGEILFGDHKTTASLGFNSQSYYDREKPNLQYSAYVMGANKVFGFNVKDFMVNIIEVKKKPLTAKGQPPNFPRQITTRTDDDLQELTETLVYFVKQYLHAKESGIWPMGPVGACNSYGACTYRMVCSAPKAMRENILKSKFTRGDQLETK